ncbi:hypothetical protein REPUB_Repub03eG0101900 [Reevesia pubescens]
MGIWYGMVARGQVVLTEFSTTQTNASTVARQILEKVNEAKNDSNSSFSQDRYIFNVKRTDGLTVLCMTDDASGRRIPFAFLEDIHKKFVKTYGQAIHSASAYAMNDEFSRVMSQQMEHFSSVPSADGLNLLKEEISQVKLSNIIVFMHHCLFQKTFLNLKFQDSIDRYHFHNFVHIGTEYND